MTTNYHYFELSPPDNDDASVLAFDDALAAILNHFDNAAIDDDSATENARKRHNALQKLVAPQEMTDLYKNPKVTRVRITNPNLDGHYIEFDLWDRQGVMVYAKPDESKLADCEMLARELATVLGYDLAVEEYD